MGREADISSALAPEGSAKPDPVMAGGSPAPIALIPTSTANSGGGL